MANNDVQRIGSEWPNEQLGGYSRVVFNDDVIWVAGTTATDGAEVVAPGDMYQQTIVVLRKIEEFLDQVGASLAEVVRTQAFLTRADGFAEFARAHREVFGSIRPVNTTVAVSALADPAMLVEIEATALRHDR